MIRPRGFTLAEVMVALVVLSIAVLGLVAVQVYSLRSVEGDRTRHVASEIASSVMAGIESRLKKDFDDPTVEKKDRVAAQDGYEYVVRTSTPQPRLKRVDIEVFYKDKTGEHSFVVWTYFFDKRIP